jgi:hypothetical protein
MKFETRRRLAVASPVVLLGAVALGLLVWARLPDNSSILRTNGLAYAAAPAVADTAGLDLAKMAATDPFALLNFAIQRYNANVRDYTCLFTKIEQLPTGVVTPEQQIEVLFKEAPFSVVMNFVKNAGPAQKILYVQGQNNGEVIIRPAGLISLVAPSVSRPANGPDALRNSRKTIDQFGLGNSLVMLRDVALKARSNGELIHLKYLGEREVDGRKTFVFERRIVENTARYPDSICIYHLDQEWLLPTAVTCLSADGTLLGKYLFSNLKINTGLTDQQFTRKANGL